MLELPGLDRGRAHRRGEVAPLVLQRRLHLDLPRAVERARALAGGGSGSGAGAAPDEQRARPVLERDADADAALDGLGLDRGGGRRRTAPTARASPVTPATTSSIERARAAGIEPVADAAVPAVQLVVRVGRQVDLGGARVDGGDEQHGALAVAAQERRDRGADDARHVRERLADRVRRRDATRGARGEARGERGDRRSSSPAARAGSGPTAIRVPPASTNSVRRRAVAASSTSHPGRTIARYASCAVVSSAPSTAAPATVSSSSTSKSRASRLSAPGRTSNHFMWPTRSDVERVRAPRPPPPPRRAAAPRARSRPGTARRRRRRGAPR